MLNYDRTEVLSWGSKPAVSVLNLNFFSVVVTVVTVVTVKNLGLGKPQ